MDILAKITLIILFFIVFYQDHKERQVHWFLFPLIGLCCGFLYFSETITELFVTSILINAAFVFLLLFLVYIYSRFKLKASFFDSIGLGDILLFFGLAFAFSSVSFIVIFICSLIFSLILYVVTKKNTSTVPLAGYMSLFFGLTYIAYWFGFINSVYSI